MSHVSYQSDLLEVDTLAAKVCKTRIREIPSKFDDPKKALCGAYENFSQRDLLDRLQGEPPATK